MKLARCPLFLALAMWAITLPGPLARLAYCRAIAIVISDYFAFGGPAGPRGSNSLIILKKQ